MKQNKTSEARLRAQRAYYERNKETILRKQKEKYQNPEYREKILDKRREEQKARTSEEKWAKGNYWKYGIRPEEYWQLFKEQGGVCAICKEPPKKQRLCVDHCHTTGKIRGLLCKSCNAGLGQFQDKESNCIEAFNYLRRTK